MLNFKFQNIKAISYQYMSFSSVYSVAVNFVLNEFICWYQHLVKEGLKERIVPGCSSLGVSWSDPSLRHTRNLPLSSSDWASYLLILAVLNTLLPYLTQSASNCFQVNRGSISGKANQTSLSYSVCREWEVNWDFLKEEKYKCTLSYYGWMVLPVCCCTGCGEEWGP